MYKAFPLEANRLVVVFRANFLIIVKQPLFIAHHKGEYFARFFFILFLLTAAEDWLFKICLLINGDGMKVMDFFIRCNDYKTAK